MWWVVVFLACAPATGDCVSYTARVWPTLTACEIDRPAMRRDLTARLAAAGQGHLVLDGGTCRPETLPPAPPGVLA